ncbi:MAG: START domain-containing protein [Oleiphilaceae bacterium]|nr:START domain-containing protein [Oleiphilaceae bacterium]
MRLTTLVPLLCLLLASHGASGDVPTDDRDWSLREDSRGIRVYTRSLEHSPFDAFRAVTELDAPMDQLMAVMGQPESCLRWVHTCIEARAVGDGDFHDRYAYSVNQMPWPVHNRDYVVRIRTSGDADGITITMDAQQDIHPRQDGLVRITHSHSVYHITPLGDEGTRLEWFQHTEPGGAVPGWLVNRMTTDLPYRSLRNLQEEVRDPRYADYRIEYDDGGRIAGLIREKAGPD